MPQKSVHYQSEKIRDIFIKILQMCQETEITSFVNSLDDMSRLFKSSNPTCNEFFEKSCFIQTKYCQSIDTLDWRVSNKNSSMVIRNDTSFIDKSEL